MNSETMRKFLSGQYKPERFEGRDGKEWGDYSASVVESSLAYLARFGRVIISRHEHKSGKAVSFTRDQIEALQS
jgi:hypothetical protein